MVYYPSILNCSYIQVTEFDVTFYLFNNGVHVHLSKLHPKAGYNISINPLFHTLTKTNNIYCVQKFLINIIIDHLIFLSTINCLKQIIKHSVILGRDKPSSQVLDIWYQWRIIIIKNLTFSKLWAMISLRYFLSVL